MCGGIVAAISLSAARRGGLGFHLLYQAGRVATYVLIGYFVGWLGSAVAYTEGFRGAGRILLLLSDVFVILVGLGSAGAFGPLDFMKLEFSGPVRTLTAAVSSLRRLPPPVAALPLGLVLGFLPCGFVYAVALTAAQTADAGAGASVMLGFGLGTAPALVAFGGVGNLAGKRAQGWMRKGAGVAVALMGLYNLVRHVAMMG
jgi:sulfite exporter TauE/SafE